VGRAVFFLRNKPGASWCQRAGQEAVHYGGAVSNGNAPTAVLHNDQAGGRVPTRKGVQAHGPSVMFRTACTQANHRPNNV